MTKEASSISTSQLQIEQLQRQVQFLENQVDSLQEKLAQHISPQAISQEPIDYGSVLDRLSKDKAIYQGKTAIIFATIVKEIAVTLQVERVSIWFLQDKNTKLKCSVSYELTNDQFAQGHSIEAAEDPAYFYLLNKEGKVDLQTQDKDSELQQLIDSYLITLKICSLYNCFIYRGAKAIGLISLEQKSESRQWTVEEITFVQAIANLVLASVEAKKRLVDQQALKQQISEFSLLKRIVNQIRSSLDSHTVFETSVSLIGQTFGVSRCYLATYEGVISPNAPIVAEYTAKNIPSLKSLPLPKKNKLHLGAVFAQEGAAK